MLLLAAALAVCSPNLRHHCVHDGDTVWIEGEKIRIADIDTPELKGQCASERKLALRARNRLVELLNAGPFSISRSGTDRYGRTLAVLHRSGRSIGGQLVTEGLARTWSGRREPWC
jgi:endonuclease YncB( thermonuclease family)